MNPTVDSTNKLNHFTSYGNVLKILQQGLKFSENYDNWEDKNDVELVKLFNRISKNDMKAGVICFLNDDETIYHWSYFTNHGCKSDVCCIEFNKKELLQLVHDKGYLFQDVQYYKMSEVNIDSPKELLFTKRYPYRFEKEYRIIRINDEEEYLPFNTNIITKITMSGHLSDKEFHTRKDYLKKEYNLTCDINHSTIYKTPIWLNKVKRITRKIKDTVPND